MPRQDISLRVELDSNAAEQRRAIRRRRNGKPMLTIKDDREDVLCDRILEDGSVCGHLRFLAPRGPYLLKTCYRGHREEEAPARAVPAHPITQWTMDAER